jgi:hypothetical protein
MTPELARTLNDPLAQELMNAPIPARMAYTGLDGLPRVIPIGYFWNGSVFIMCTDPSTPKVRALETNPHAALTIDTNGMPPHVLLVRGSVTMETVDGVPDEYLRASRRYIPAEQWDEFLRDVYGLYERMVKIALTPTWAKLLDFQTRVPEFIERKMKAAAGD